MQHQTTIKAIAFDLDGTLVDSVPGLTQALNLALHDQHLRQLANNKLNNGSVMALIS